jgi:hypothetical protein
MWSTCGRVKVDTRLTPLQKQRDLLEGYSSRVTTAIATEGLVPASVETLSKFLSFYESSLAEIDSRLLRLNREITGMGHLSLCSSDLLAVLIMCRSHGRAQCSVSHTPVTGTPRNIPGDAEFRIPRIHRPSQGHVENVVWREVTITLHARAEGPAVLQLSYITMGAEWTSRSASHSIFVYLPIIRSSSIRRHTYRRHRLLLCVVSARRREQG